MSKLHDAIIAAHARASQDLHDARHDIAELQRREERARQGSEKALAEVKEAEKAAAALDFVLPNPQVGGSPIGSLTTSWSEDKGVAVWNG